jgi:tight adherence protein B
MTPLMLVLLAGAILMAAFSLLLWQNAQANTRRQATWQFVDQQIRNALHLQPEVLESEDELPMRRRRARFRWWRQFLQRAGIAATPAFYLRLILPAIALTVMAAVFGGLLSAIATIMLYSAVMAFRFWLKLTKRHQRMVQQLPVFLDSMVRLTTVGNSLESAFQATVPNTDAPFRELLDQANSLVQAGMDLEHALAQQARIYRLTELQIIAAVIGIALRFGGRADTVLERMAAFMRDREQAQNELVALSAEIRLSAWVLGLLPIGIGAFIVIFNNHLFTMMLGDPLGRPMLITAAVLEVIGACWLYRLAKAV